LEEVPRMVDPIPDTMRALSRGGPRAHPVP
jgi:hypothetical protein